MPLPLIPAIAALATGGTLVPHAVGELIVTFAGSYIAGTHLSTAAIATLLAGGATAFGTGVAVVSGAAQESSAARASLERRLVQQG